jgi:hypothetical protein
MITLEAWKLTLELWTSRSSQWQHSDSSLEP